LVLAEIGAMAAVVWDAGASPRPPGGQQAALLIKQ